MGPDRITEPPSSFVLAACLGFLYLTWGSSYVAFQIQFKSLPPLLSTGTSFAIAGYVLLGFALAKGQRPSRAELCTGVVLALVMIGVSTAGVVLALPHLASSTAALIQASIPMWVVLGDRIVFGTQLRTRTVAGIAVGFGGIAFLVTAGKAGGSSQPVWMLVILLASVAWAGGILATRVLPRIESGTLSVGLQMSLGGTLLAIAGICNGDADHLNSVTTSSIIAAGYLTVTVAGAAYLIFMWLIPRAPASLIATSNYVDPVVTLLTGWLLLGQGISIRSASATVAILAGVVLIVSAGKSSVPSTVSLAAASADALAGSGEVDDLTVPG